MSLEMECTLEEKKNKIKVLSLKTKAATVVCKMNAIIHKSTGSKKTEHHTKLQGSVYKKKKNTAVPQQPSKQKTEMSVFYSRCPFIQLDHQQTQFKVQYLITTEEPEQNIVIYIEIIAFGCLHIYFSKIIRHNSMYLFNYH